MRYHEGEVKKIAISHAREVKNKWLVTSSSRKIVVWGKDEDAGNSVENRKNIIITILTAWKSSISNFPLANLIFNDLYTIYIWRFHFLFIFYFGFTELTDSARIIKRVIEVDKGSVNVSSPLSFFFLRRRREKTQSR